MKADKDTQPIRHVPGQMHLIDLEEIATEPPHTPTHVTGTAKVTAGEVTYDYVGCSVCRIDHPVVGPNVPQPWERAHPGPLPASATDTVPDGKTVRQ